MEGKIVRTKSLKNIRGLVVPRVPSVKIQKMSETFQERLEIGNPIQKSVDQATSPFKFQPDETLFRRTFSTPKIPPKRRADTPNKYVLVYKSIE